MKKILFYVSNGVGLGHLRRIQIISEKLKKRGVRIILTTSSLSPQKLGNFYDHLIKLKPFSDGLKENQKSYLKARTKNEKKLFKTVEKFKPDIIVSDFHLSQVNFTFLPLKRVLDSFKIKSVFIWRLDSFKTFSSDISRLKERLDYFDKIILPHSLMEMNNFLSLSFLKKIKLNPKFKIINPIFRKIDKDKIIQVKKKYNISNKNFNLLLTFGAGGELNNYCQSPKEIINKFLSIYSDLKKEILNLKTIISTGPYLDNFKKKKFKGLKIIGFEKNLPELIKLSDLVVSSAGYNACNEIINAKTPTILIPLKRAGNEQFERVEFLEKEKVAIVVRNPSEKELFKTIVNSKNNLKKNKDTFRKIFSGECGNKEIIKIILKELNEN